MKALTVCVLLAGALGSTSFAGEIHPQPGQVFSSQVGISRVQEINNPPKSDSQAGRAIENRDIQPKRKLPHLEPNDGQEE
jgi:hypothetical protein